MLSNKIASGVVTGRKVSPPTPTYMTDDQKSNYLKELRSNRPNRPIGSRPAPFKTPHLARSDSGASIASHESSVVVAASKPAALSSPGKGRPLASAPTLPSPNLPVRSASPEYMDSETRRLEKEEAHTLRKALHMIDLADDEKRIYEAAQAEAADLVWKHRNPHAAEDELTAPYFNPDFQKAKTETGAARKLSNGPASHRDLPTVPKRTTGDKELSAASQETGTPTATGARERRRSSGKRLASGGASKTLFRNPEDQIFEEPRSAPDGGETGAILPEPPLRIRSSNAVPRDTRPAPVKALSTPAKRLPWLNRVEIHRNPPSQSRNAAYTSNTPPPVPKKDDADTPEAAKSTDSLEIRSDDIRAATSMKKKDRSPKLPTPVAVSDMPGRPIVSFNPDWRPKDSPRNSADLDVSSFHDPPRATRELPSPVSRPAHSHSNSAPGIPVIHVSEEDSATPAQEIEVPSNPVNVPTIRFEDAEDSGPAISVTGPSISVTAPSTTVSDKPAERKLPARPLPARAATLPSSTTTSRPSWMNRNGGLPTSVSCTACTLPISGRIVTAAGSKSTGSTLKARFHPNCFRCAHCSTRLEAVAFYPEPDEARQARIDESEQPDVEESDVRFYCHLDFHELFSPRCRSCKTPIEGAVVNACGHTYHEDHFFCAECGDPFSSTTPFVEHNGYAYCVTCHTRRTSARCKACKQVILDELTVEALGGKWHEQCFVCYECQGSFGSEGRFFIRDVAVQPTDKERRRGILKKMEERAVCQACEEIRLKACACAATPPGLDIDQKTPLNGTMAAYQKHILVGSGQADWLSKIEDENNGDGDSDSDSAGWGALVAELKRAVGQPITQPIILICSHGGRDQRCGIFGPLLMQEFRRQLRARSPHRGDATDTVHAAASSSSFDHQAINVAGVSHIGGHKWAGNVILYIPPGYEIPADDEPRIWYGRVEPRHVEGIIEQTLFRGKVIQDLFRGGINRQGHPLRL
ncbi:hypothetical protein DV738_g3476, partial [Chaetothyriales sp. CBS 135597]